MEFKTSMAVASFIDGDNCQPHPQPLKYPSAYPKLACAGEADAMKKTLVFLSALLVALPLAAQNGPPKQYPKDEANYSLGMQAENALSYSKAYKWYRLAADHGDSRAMDRLGAMYSILEKSWLEKNMREEERRLYKGKTNLDMARMWWKKAANIGNTDAMVHLGRDSRKNPAHLKEAFQWFKSAAEAGDIPSMKVLAQMYRDGEGTESNRVESRRWRMAYLERDVESQFKQGLRYEFGDGEKKDYTKAKYWYLLAFNNKTSQEDSNGRNPNKEGAAYRLGVLYEEGKGVPQNIPKAVEWYRQSQWAEAGMRLGSLYAEGTNVKQDFQEAVKWYEVASWSFPMACASLGDIYQNHFRDNVKSYQWFLAATEFSDSDKQRKTVKFKLNELKKRMNSREIQEAEKREKKWVEEIARKRE
jgi:uncharacterized protein